MNDHEELTGVRAELWVRSAAPGGTGAEQTAMVDALRTLERVDDVEGIRLRMWDKQISRSAPVAWTEEGRAVIRCYEEIESWADEQGLSLAPFFECKTVRCEFTDTEDDVICLPSMALVEYRGDEIRHVAPHSKGEIHVSVADRLDALFARYPEERSTTRVVQPAGASQR